MRKRRECGLLEIWRRHEVSVLAVTIWVLAPLAGCVIGWMIWGPLEW